MSSADESPAQRSARLRRERREAKIRDGGTARLDKITSMGGRTPVSAREDSSPSPQPLSRTASMPEAAPQTQPAPAPAAPNAEIQSPETIQAQQEYLRAFLRQSAPPEGQQGLEEDPMKLLSSLLGGVPGGDQNAGGAAGEGGAEGAPGLSPADIAASLGVPPFLANLLGAVGSKPQTEAEKKQARTWKALHIAFSIAVAVYLLFLVGASVTTYGSQPPPPATAQNPFVIFVTGEMVLSGARLFMRSRDGGAAGLVLCVQLFRDVVRDGSVVLFLLGMATWWHRAWLA